MKNISLRTHKRCEFIDITKKVQEVVNECGVQNGAVMVFVGHTTAGITINENADPSVVEDLLDNLGRLAPENGDYRHSEGNSDAHCKASLMGSSVLVPVKNGELVLGSWQGIYFCEFDGPRSRRFQVVNPAVAQ
jgi:secondary thiamine-phosphate synthase enzyme